MINLNKKDGCLTIMEIMMTLLVLGALAGLVFPRFEMQMEKARAAEAVQILEALFNAQTAYYAEYKTYTNNLANLDITFRPSSYYSVPTLSMADPIVSVQRNDSSYTLSMATTGIISCVPAGGTCGHLGY